MSWSALAFLVMLAIGTLPAGAQQPTKVPRIGVLISGSPTTHRFMADAFRQDLRELGHIEGQNISLEYRWAEGKLDRLPDLAAELVRLKVDVIVVGGTTAVRAAKQATGTIPIVVFGAGNLVGAGLVASLARPGGNITGTHDLSPELSSKRLELLKETVPKLSRVAVLWNPTSSARALREIEAAARTFGMQLQVLEVRTPDEFQGAYAAMIRQRADALVIVMDSFTLFHRRKLVDLSVKSRLPMVCEASEFASDGCLIAYGPDRLDAIRKAAGFVDRILKGAKPADLPIDQPTKFHLVINLKTAKALGVTIPQSLLARADHVIQ